MNLGKGLILLVVLFSVLGVFAFAESLSVVSAENVTTITHNSMNIAMGHLHAVITVKIKNNADHMQFFKISQQYSQVSPPIQWNVNWTDPKAVKMATNANPIGGLIANASNNTTINNSTGDLGWEIEAGETKTVSFQLDAIGLGGDRFGGIFPNATVDNTFFPLLSEPGLSASWFLPTEIEGLNPNLKVVDWVGKFDFDLIDTNPLLNPDVNAGDTRVEGLVAAPIVPLDSELTSSDPTADFVDKSFPGANTATWDVTLFPDGTMKHFTYTYHFPKAAAGSATGNGSSATLGLTNTTPTTTVPTQNTGVPYGLLAMAVIIVGAGVGYAKFLR